MQWEDVLWCFKCFSWLLPLLGHHVNSTAGPLRGGRARRGELSRQCSWGTSGFRVRIAHQCLLAFSNLKMSFICLYVFLLKSKTKNLKRSKDIQIAKQRRIQWHNQRRNLLNRNKVAQVLIMANWVGHEWKEWRPYCKNNRLSWQKLALWSLLCLPC